MMNLKSIEMWIRFIQNNVKKDDEYAICQSMLDLIDKRPDFLEMQTEAFNLMKRQNQDKDVFTMRMLEDREYLSGNEYSVFDYLIRNMSQDNTVMLVPKEDFKRLKISRATYDRTLNGLVKKDYITKIPKSNIDGHTSKEVRYYMINPVKASKRNVAGRNKLIGKYKLIRGIEYTDTVIEPQSENYHTMTSKIRVKFTYEDEKKEIYLDVNSITDDDNELEQNKKALTDDVPHTSARTNTSTNILQQSE